MIGGRDYGDSQFNRVTQAKRQPGSAFKLFVYLAGLENGFAPDDLVIDSKIDINGWSPKNYKDKYIGEVSVKDAFSNSINTVAVKICESFNNKTNKKKIKIVRFGNVFGSSGSAISNFMDKINNEEIVCW